MCGISGILGENSVANTMHISKMLEVQKHRGPDAISVWHDDTIVLGHNRLSIIDLSKEANQPMVSNCGNFIIVFNGELYNYLEIKEALHSDYQFKTSSDTEVLLAAYIRWGSAMLHEFNGMFSIAIWNKKEQKLFVARDRFGVKPFYYAISNNQFYFSSEIKTLFAVGLPKVKNKKVWANYFAAGTYGMPNETFWEGIHQLPAGHFFEIQFTKILKDDAIKLQKWYDFPARIATLKSLPEAILKIQYEILLKDAIQLRFRADVPLGMNVSGGLDSSVLISLIHQNLPSKKTLEAFTFYCNNKAYDELPWVNELMKTTPYPLNKVLLDYNNVPKLIKEVSYYQDEPYGGFPTLAYSLLFKEARKKGILVVLDGQGMDEAWGGYDYYYNNSSSIIQGITTSPVRPEVLDADFLRFAETETYEAPFDNLLQNLQYRDLFYTKIPRALRFNDRISMMHSTELREPFLDYRLVELAFVQTEAMKFQNGQTKWLLRELVKKYLGTTIALAPKRPLQTPQREWISNELKDYFFHQIQCFSKNDYVNKGEVLSVWSSYLNGNQDNSFYLWQWVNTVSIE